MPEALGAWLANRYVAIGVVPRPPDQPNRSVLVHRGAEGGRLVDVFIAWQPSKTVALTAACGAGPHRPCRGSRAVNIYAYLFFNWRLDPCVLSSPLCCSLSGPQRFGAQNADPPRPLRPVRPQRLDARLPRPPRRRRPHRHFFKDVSPPFAEAFWRSRPARSWVWPCQCSAPMKLLHQEF